jgi:hypothetical protein
VGAVLMASVPATATPRSTFVTVVGWIFTVLGGFATLIALLQNVMVAVVFSRPEFQEATKHAKAQGLPWFASFMFDYFQLFFIAVLFLSACCLAGAIGLLLRKNWARLLFVTLMCFGIAWNAAGLVVTFFMFSVFGAAFGKAAAQGVAPPGFDLMWKIIAGVNVLFVIGFIALFTWIIMRLVSPEVRREFGVA